MAGNVLLYVLIFERSFIADMFCSLFGFREFNRQTLDDSGNGYNGCVSARCYSLFITLLFGVVIPHKPNLRLVLIPMSVCFFFRFVQAMRYLSYALYPLLLAGAVYSLVYHPHKRYSKQLS